MDRPVEPAVEAFFAGSPLGRSVFERVVAALAVAGDPVTVRVSKSQVGFRSSRGFAYLWLPGRYLRTPGAEVVLSVALSRRDASARFKEVTRIPGGRWMHHLELRDPGEIDSEVLAWLEEAASEAAQPAGGTPSSERGGSPDGSPSGRARRSPGT